MNDTRGEGTTIVVDVKEKKGGSNRSLAATERGGPSPSL